MWRETQQTQELWGSEWPEMAHFVEDLVVGNAFRGASAH